MLIVGVCGANWACDVCIIIYRNSAACQNYSAAEGQFWGVGGRVIQELSGLTLNVEVVGLDGLQGSDPVDSRVYIHWAFLPLVEL